MRDLPLDVGTAGFQRAGEPPTDETVRRLGHRGIDAAGHRSSTVDADGIDDADLILTAEQQHVVEIAVQGSDAFKKTFTLPEFVRRATATPPAGNATFGGWLDEIQHLRPRPVDYLGDPVGEIEDPTGGSRAVWNRVVAQLESLTDELCRILELAPPPSDDPEDHR